MSSITLQDFRLVDPRTDTIPLVTNATSSEMGREDTAVSFFLIRDAESYEGWTNGLILACCIPGHPTTSHWDDINDIYVNSGFQFWVEVITRHVEHTA